MAAILNLPRSRFEAIYWRSRLEYDEAKLDPIEYWGQFGPTSPAQIEQLNRLDAASWMHPAAIVPAWAGQLREAGYRIALLSNMPFTVRAAVLHCDWLPEFDQRTFSCELGISKPAAEIYEHCLGGLDVAAEEALFLDDRPANVEGAKALGMPAILFTAAEAVLPEVAGSFDIPQPRIAGVPTTHAENE